MTLPPLERTTAIGRRVATSHNRIAPEKSPVASVRPSGLNSRAVASSTGIDPSSSPVVVTSRTGPFITPTAIVVPSGSTACPHASGSAIRASSRRVPVSHTPADRASSVTNRVPSAVNVTPVTGALAPSTVEPDARVSASRNAKRVSGSSSARHAVAARRCAVIGSLSSAVPLWAASCRARAMRACSTAVPRCWNATIAPTVAAIVNAVSAAPTTCTVRRSRRR
ncbi:hypothetical protein GCM10009539_61540 [Cryptosporangium japonicum]|uniref:Uncharacterized protein n=1 Tax=Cryptosporangium japonicum TaxID=80872 RepID=A0ABP3EJT2_9ACTN